jgi:beta-lactam-binding protein with PASTA domain
MAEGVLNRLRIDTLASDGQKKDFEMRKSMSLVQGSVAFLCLLLLAPFVSAQVIVPDVTATMLPLAEAVITGVGLTVGDKVFVFDELAPQGLVTDQNPFSGSNVPPGTAVNLWVSAGPHPCPDLFDYSQQTWKVHIGGAAVADAIATVDTGSAYPEYHNYDAWDINEDGILDKTQIALLMYLICLPPGTQHPTIDIDAVQAAFQQNLGVYDDLIVKIKADETDAIAAAPVLVDMGTELKNRAIAVGMQNNLVTADAFVSKTLPDEWVGKTYGQMADFMFDAGDGILWAEGKNYIGDQATSLAWVTADNEGTRLLGAALIGLDETLVDRVLALSQYDELNRALSLLELDWVYLDGLFTLAPTILQDIQDASDLIEITPDDVPVLDEDFGVFESEPGTELLDPQTEWGTGGETLEDIINTIGDDPEVIWETVEEDVTIPVPDVTGLLLPAAQSTIIASNLTVGNIVAVFDDMAVAGTVLDQAPLAGVAVMPGDPVDLWVSSGPNPCPEFFDQWGVATMTIGGLAIADAIEQLDVGNDFTEYHDYLLWDVNGDGVLDSLQFELLARVLCLPDNYEHPEIGPVKPIQDAFYANLAEFNDRLAKYFDKEDEMIAAAQPLLDVGNQILAVGGALLSDPITPEYNLSEVWNGLTLGDLADMMVYIGDGTLYHLNHGNIGPGGVIRQTFEGNVSTSHLAAAIMGLDSGLLDQALGHWRYDEIEKGLALADLNWQHLLDLLEASGLDAGLVNDVEAAIAATEVGLGDVPANEDLATLQTDDGNDLLDPNTIWGDAGETLQDLIDTLGGDFEDIWNDIDDAFTPIPPVAVPDVTNQALAVAEANVVAAGLVVGDVVPQFDDLAPVGTVIDQNPLGGALALPGSAVNLWVSAGPNQCPEFFDNWGVATMTIGGRAIADAFAQADTGNEFPEYHDFDLWDINEDGILDIVQFELLARILCLPDNYEHPVIGPVKPVQDAFYANLALYNEKLTKLLDIEEEMIAAAQPLKDVANQILAVGGALLDDPITPEYNLPEVWDGSTLRDLAEFMLEIGGHVTWNLSQGNIGPGGLFRATLEGNDSTAHLVAAVMGLDTDILDWAFGNWRYGEVEKALALANLNWQHLLDLLQALGLDPALVNEVQTLIEDTTIVPEDIVVQDELPVFQTDDGDDLLDPNTIWGDSGETLQDLVDAIGNDPDAIFDDISDTFTEMPTVPDVTGMLLPAAEADILAAGLVTGAVAPVFNAAPVGTVLDQNPFGGTYAPTGSAVNLWVSAGPNPCPEFFDEWGVATMTIGGLAIADAISQVDTNDRFAQLHVYQNWDLNNDGIADSVQLELLAHILCLPDNYEHPVIGPVKPIQDAFYANLALYTAQLDKYWAKEDAVIAVAQPLKNLANDMLATGDPALDGTFDPAALNLPDSWAGFTLRELAEFMIEAGGGVTWNVSQGNIGPGGLVHATLENNTSTDHLFAALMGLDSDTYARVLAHRWYAKFERGMALADLDWQALLSLLSGLDAGLVNQVDTLMEDTDYSLDDVPTEEELAVYEDEGGLDLLDPDTVWGESGETLQDLIDDFGDADTIWNDIEDQFTEIMPVPVPDVTGIDVVDAGTTIILAGLQVGNVVMEFNDLAAVGTVLDQNPLAGVLVMPDTFVNLWVSAGPNPCPVFFDQWGETTFAIGGRAVADAIEQADTVGDFTEYYDYDSWDIDEDGVLDRFMFDMLARVLCLPDTYVHPALGPIKPIQDAFYSNLDAVNTVLNKYWDKEDEIIALAQPMKDLANQILSGCGTLLDAPITPEYGLSAEWDGKTVGDLAQFMLDAGGHVTWHLSQGNIGPGGLIHTVLDGNVSTSHLLAAVIALDSNLGGEALGSGEYRDVQRALSLVDLDWDYLMIQLASCGLDPVLVDDVEVLIDDTGFTPDDLDDDLYIVTDEDGNDLLDPDTEWGDNGETLQDLIDALGDDPDAIWADIEVLFDEPPVITLIGDAVVTAECGEPYVDAGATAADKDLNDITAWIMVGGDIVDTSVLGTYVITYNVDDAVGRSAVEVTRTVNVIDTTAPVITVVGGDETVECGDMYVVPSATALDACVGDVPVVVDNPVDTGAPGMYTVTYTATDGTNVATSLVVVTVVDTIAPVITVLGGDETVQCGDMYIVPSATALDACVGDVPVVVDNPVDTNVPSMYTVTYTATDGTNVATELVIVTVVDTMVPVIALGGDAAVTVECGDTYTDAGATAADDCEGDLTGAIVVGGAVDTAVPGDYTLTYNVSDTAANAAVEVTRTVTVTDTTAPVITLGGDAAVTVECGDTYTDAGATAADDCEGDLTGAIVVGGVVDTAVPGDYTLTYNVSDTAANAAVEVTRTVTVTDTTAPVITLGGDAAVTVECGDTYTDAGATAADDCEGDLTGAIVVGGAVDTAVPGDYTLTYNVSDTAANAAVEVTRTVTVTDTTAPVITLGGDAAVTVECGDTYTDAGATAADDCEGDLTGAIVVGGAVDTAVPGDYTLTYNVSDSAANAAVEVTRTVTVADTTAPVITLGGDAAVTVECGDTYTDAGATAADTCEGDLTGAIVVGGAVDTAVPGDYTLTYNVSDTAANAAAEVTRTVTVADTTAPVITLAGDAAVTVECGDTYTDAGATAADDCDGDLTGAIVFGGFVDTAVPGDYTLTYNVSDSAANAAVEVARMVTVADTTAPVITLGGDAAVTVECGDTYTDAGATAADTCEGDLTGAIVVGGAVDTAVPGDYTLTYNVSDSAANVAVEVARMVTVADTTAPVITFGGDAAVTVECGDTYTDAGATAVDTCEGDLTGAIVAGGAVDTAVPGDYTLTYNVSDSAANAAVEVARMVTVADTTAPVITLAGDAAVTVECGDTYTDAGATAADTCEGDLTGAIVVGGAVDTAVPGDYTLTYNVSDSAANAAAEVARMVTVADTIAPVITLAGDAAMTIELCDGDEIPVLPGAAAMDACDGDLSANVVVGGDVVTTTPGAYMITYSATDAAGNNAVEVRTVTVQVPDGFNIVLDALQITVECGDAFEAPDGEVRNGCDEPVGLAAVQGTVNTLLPGDYTLTYSYAGATDATLVVTVSDTMAPVVALAGEEAVVLEDCVLYEELGLATVIDQCEGDMSSFLTPEDVLVSVWSVADQLYTNTDLASVEVVFNTFYAEVSGEYALVYAIEDSAGNEGLAERSVTVNCVPQEGEGEPVEGEGEPVEGEGEPVEGEGEPVEGEGEPVEGEPVEGEGEPVEGEGEPVEGEGEPVEGEPVEGEPVEGEGEPVEGEGEPVEGEGEPVEGEPVEGEGEPVEGEGEPVEGEGEPVEGEGEPVEGEGEPVEGEGEPVEGEGEPVEGEGEPVVDDIIDNFDDLDADGDGLLSCTEIGTLSEAQCAGLDTDGDGYISYNELISASGGVCIPSLNAEDAQIECSDYEIAQAAVTAAFESVVADNGCRVDLTEAVRVKQIAWINTRGLYEILDLDEIIEKLDAFEDGEYDGSIDKTRKLFHYYFVFKPGDYDITWEIVVDDAPLSNYEATLVQWIRVDSSCKGCLGCNSNCAGCRDRHIPAEAADLKQMLSNWLLIGLSVLVMLSWSVVNKR